MNHIYRIIFNRASGVFQVVSELAKGKVKSAKTSVKLTALCMALVSGAVLADEPASTSAPAADNTAEINRFRKEISSPTNKNRGTREKNRGTREKTSCIKKICWHNALR